MAEGLMKALVDERGEEWRIESAGVWAITQAPVAENTLKLLLQRGVDLSTHASRQVTLQMMEEFNLILTMESNHQEALRAAFPQHSERIFQLSEMVGRKVNIADPIGFPLAVFENTAEEIDSMLKGGFSLIARLAAGADDDRRD